MLTVNLEKELLKQNAIIHTPEELLEIKEYERLGNDVCESEVLSRVGLNRSAMAGFGEKEQRIKGEESIQKYNRERVFHRSQIEALCKKYHLRFLRSDYYSGAIDSELAGKISTYEVAYDETCTHENTFIAAPKSAFTLEAKPKDPLFFKGIGRIRYQHHEYYYLIHKWGSDLSIFRRCLHWLSSPFLVPIIYLAFCIWFFVSTIEWEQSIMFNIIGVFVAIVVAAGIFVAMIAIKNLIKDKDDWTIRIVPKNNWESFYDD